MNKRNQGEGKSNLALVVDRVDIIGMYHPTNVWRNKTKEQERKKLGYLMKALITS